jgi:hypothetical protein
MIGLRLGMCAAEYFENKSNTFNGDIDGLKVLICPDCLYLNSLKKYFLESEIIRPKFILECLRPMVNDKYFFNFR